jgi:hypothetical protein
MTPKVESLSGEYSPDPSDDGLINPISMTPKEFERQHGPQPGVVVTWHNKRVPPPERSHLTLAEVVALDKAEAERRGEVVAQAAGLNPP